MDSFVLYFAITLLISLIVGYEGNDHTTIQQSTTSVSMSDAKVPLTIYYEALCPDSIKFFKEQLDPTYSLLSNHLDIKFIPFGKATQWYSSNSYQFSCHHKEEECYGNIVQSCAIEKYLEMNDRVKYLICVMTTVDPKTISNATYPAQKCAESSGGLEYESLKSCIEGPEGLKLLSEMGNKTSALNPPLRNVPSVAVNNKYSYDDQAAATGNLKLFICSRLNSPKPSACNDSITVSASMMLVTLVAVSLSTIVPQLLMF